jgi:hypothetical protein
VRRALESPPIWGRAAKVVLLVFAVIGAVTVTIAWIGVSGTTDWDNQVGWIAVGGLGAMVGAFAGVVWLMLGFGAVHHRARYLTGILGPAIRPDQMDWERSDSLALKGLAVSADSMTRYHRADCSLVRGKPTQSDRIDDLRARGRRPCGVCKP